MLTGHEFQHIHPNVLVVGDLYNSREAKLQLSRQHGHLAFYDHGSVVSLTGLAQLWPMLLFRKRFSEMAGDARQK